MTWHPSQREIATIHEKSPGVARQGSNLQSSVTEYLVSALLQNKFTLDFFLPGGPQEWDRTCNLRFRQQARGEKVPRARNRRFERWSPQGLLEGHVSTRDGDTLARLNRYRSPVGCPVWVAHSRARHSPPRDRPRPRRAPPRRPARSQPPRASQRSSGTPPTVPVCGPRTPQDRWRRPRAAAPGPSGGSP